MLMSTTTLHMSLPESLKRFVREQVEREHFSNPSDYIRALIRAEQKRLDEKRLEHLVLEGLASGPGVSVGTPEWEAFWKKIQERIETR